MANRNTNGLLDYFGDLNVFGAGPDATTQSLLDAKLITPEAIKSANKRSIGTGIMTGIASYLAQPRNQNYGSIVPYLGKAYLNANKAAQAPFEGFTDKYLMDTKIAENQRVLGQRNMTNETFAKLAESNPDLKQYLNMNVDFKNKIIKELYTKSQASPTLKAVSQEDDLFSVDPDGTTTLKRAGIKKVDNTGLYPTTAVELANGDFAFLPTPKGMRQGYSAIGVDGQPYTKDITPRSKGMTDPQTKAFKFGSRMEASNANFERLFDKDGNPTYSPAFIASKRNAEKTWVVGEMLGAGANYFASEEDQMASQSMRDFINAALRDESGAAIAEHEFTNAQAQYFPEVNDSKSVMRQKSENRTIAIQVMKTAAGQDPKAKALAEEYVRAVKAGEDITQSFGGTYFKKNNDTETTTKPIARRAKINGRILVEDLSKGQWVYEDTGEEFGG